MKVAHLAENVTMPPMADKKRKGSRHKDRHTVSLPGEIYELMRQAAEKGERPLRSQVVLACKEQLRHLGLLPPPTAPEQAL